MKNTKNLTHAVSFSGKKDKVSMKALKNACNTAFGGDDGLTSLYELLAILETRHSIWSFKNTNGRFQVYMAENGSKPDQMLVDTVTTILRKAKVDEVMVCPV